MQSISSRLLLALLAYAALGFMAWRTMENDNFRALTLMLLGFFAVRTIMQANHEQQARREEEDRDNDGVQ